MITTGIVWAYEGFRQSLEYAGETKNPQRDVPLGTLATYAGSSGRNIYGMARVDYIPEFFARIHPRFRSPWVALLASTVIAVAFLLPFPTWYAIMSISSLATVYNTFWLSCPFRININGVLYSNTCDRSHG
jgi:amino acid transporter